MTYIPYEKGVLGVLYTQWLCLTKTPLVVRNGYVSSFKQSDTTKGRGTNLEFNWEVPNLSDNVNSNFSKTSDFNYEFLLDNDNIIPSYSIPASSIRGCLRNAAINFLVNIKERNLFDLPNKQDSKLTLEEIEKKISDVKQILNTRKSYWFDILSLFGNTFEINSEEPADYTWAGRLRVETKIENQKDNSTMQYSGKNVDIKNGPRNVNTEIGIRNPIDRVTQGAKAKGLHSWVEMCAKQELTLKLHILNPTLFDIKLLNLWKNNINNGMIRFGALTQHGKGELSVEKEIYGLYISQKSALHEDILWESQKDILSDLDHLAGIWSGCKFNKIEPMLGIDLSKLTQTKGA